MIYFKKNLFSFVLVCGLVSSPVYAQKQDNVNQNIGSIGQTGVTHSTVLMNILQLDERDSAINGKILSYNFRFLDGIDPAHETIGDTPYEIFLAELFFADVWLSIYVPEDIPNGNNELTLVILKQTYFYLERLGEIKVKGRTYVSDLFGLGINVSQQNIKQALAWTETAAWLGLENAQMALADYYDQFENNQDYLKAYKWLLILANRNNREALYRLGTYFEDGLGVQKDPKRAFYYYEKAANDGEVKAYGKLAIFYAKGIGVRKDLQSAFEYSFYAAQKRDTDSQAYVAMAYLNGDGVEQNDEQALLWGKRAADDFRKNYQCLYGTMLFDGRGTNPEKLAGYTFCEVAHLLSDRTDDNIGNELKRMAKELNESDIKKAKDIAKSCYKESFYSCANPF
ncbi:sel1 repeat family protein (plasmid) [Bartonella sp. HY329]|uniref:tetratricopeptide repeat protein n=1 Tax=unclassified Bartonella TaxID=2645622 RepID=UPI0021C95872|nr:MULTISPECIES: tetratricopeptide repeat protein [unclassified Bartonella]UXM96538.1 sel1 repeat family protein [Bartonella sp. HY329]UXN10861.1 sel1 repeat family protein [Bartonella sp. HY328]